MHPILFQFTLINRPITIGTYGVFIILAISTAVIMALVLGKRLNHNRDETFNTVTLIACGGILGALFTGFLIFLPERVETGFFSYPPVLVSWGGITGGILTLLILRHTWHLDPLFYSDLLGPSYITGIGIGRIGCHFAGCCYGIHTTCPLSVSFKNPLAPAAVMHQPLVPTQLISAAVLITGGILFFIIAARGSRTGKGFLFLSTLIFYGTFRFTIEFFRADPRGFMGPFSDGQLFSLAAVIAGLTGIILLKKKYSFK